MSETARSEEHQEIYRTLLHTIRGVRRRWRMRVALRGLSIALGMVLAIVLVSAWAMDAFLYSQQSVMWFRIFAWVTVLTVLVRYLLLPLLQRVPDRRVALYIEEHEPSLQSSVLSAVELGREVDGSSAELRRSLLVDAIQRCEQIEYAQGIERAGLRRFTGTLAGVAGAGMLATLLSPAFLQHGAMLLLMPWKASAADNPYRLDVAPGDTRLARGADLQVQARLLHFDSAEVWVSVRSEGESWERLPMTQADATGAFGVAEAATDYEAMVLDLRERTEYFVEAGTMRSATYSVDVVELPYVDQLDLEYRFPAYTRLQPQVIEDGGDVAALVGTEVVVSVLPTVAISGGWLRIDSGEEIALTELEDERWQATFVVAEPAFYRIDLLDLDGEEHRASPEYAIDPLRDQPPILRMLRPGRDIKANKLEEVFVELAAEDDFGVRRLSLHYSVNGGEEQVEVLADGGLRKEVSVGHTYFLEELDLADGDFISYYGTATDGRRQSGGQVATSDIYFIEVRPFGQEYRRAPEGGGGGGGGDGLDSSLSLRQREIVAATFRLVRDEKTFDDKEYGEHVQTVALSQQRLREQVQTLIERMSNRAQLMGDDDFKKIIGELELAMPEMVKARDLLEARKPKEALGPEQVALSYLQRAESTFRDVRVSFDQSGGGGGGQSQLSEDLADLFELELDKLRNQYEVVQRGQEQQAAQEIDEVEQRLKELARRQQREIERRRRQGLPQSGGGGGGGQQELIEETEELARKLEKLAREQAQPELRQTARRLQEAVDQMRRSAASPGTAGQNSGVRALEALEEARRLMDKSKRLELDREMEEVQRQAQQIRNLENRISSQVDRLGSEEDADGRSGEGRQRRGEQREGQGQRQGSERQSQGEQGEGEVSNEDLQRILERKEQLGEQIAGLEEQLDRMARQARGEAPEVARRLQEAANGIRKNQLKEKIRYSRGVVSEREGRYAQAFEDEIERNVDELLGKLEAAGSAAAGEQGRDREDVLAQARDLVERMESFENRLRDRSHGGEEGQGSEQGSQGQEPSQQGERGQQGEQPGSEGQEGSQPGQQPGTREGQQGQQGQGQSQQGQQGQGQQGQGQQSQQGQQGQTGEQGEGSESGQGDGSQGGRRLRPGNQERGGEQGGGWAANQMGSSTGGQFQPGVFSNRELRQLGREMQQRMEEAGELRESLQEMGMNVSDLDDVLEQMRRFSMRRINNDPLALDALRGAVVEELRQFEFRLWRDLEGGEGSRVHLSGEEQIPPGYEERVEEYFRKLAQAPGS